MKFTKYNLLFTTFLVCLGVSHSAISAEEIQDPKINTKAIDLAQLKSQTLQSVYEIPGSESLNQKHIINVGLNSTVLLRLPKDYAEIITNDNQTLTLNVRTRRDLFVVGKRLGTTDIVFLDNNGNSVATVTLVVGLDLTPLQEILDQRVGMGKVFVTSLNGSIMLQGRVRSSSDLYLVNEMAKKWTAQNLTGSFGSSDILNMIEVDQSDMVTIKLKVAEISRSVGKGLGLRLGFGYENASKTFGTTLDTTPVNGVASALSPLQGNSNAIVEQGSSSPRPANINYKNAPGSLLALDATLKALESSSLAKVLAEPVLTAVSGETADFMAGSEFPIAVASKEGPPTITYKQYGISASFTPTILAEDKINLQIKAEVSNIDKTSSAGGSSGATVNPRRVSTTVELPSGGTQILAGLVSTNYTGKNEGIPGLKDVPVLSMPFSTKEYENKETELVIMVTPYITKPKHESELTTPVDGFIPPSGSDLFLHNQLETKRYDDGKTKKINSLAGYVIE